MAVSLRLDKNLEHELARAARLEGESKSDLIRAAVSEFLARMKRPVGQTPWTLGKDVFGRHRSGRDDLSTNRKALLKEKLNAKHHRG